MDLGLLGTDARMSALAAAAVARGHRITLTADGPAGAFPPAPTEALLDPAGCDVVLVGSDGWSESRAEAVRLLVQSGRSVVASQPLVLSMLWAWELEMIRRDVGGLLLPVLPERRHPLVARLRGTLERALAGAGTLGHVELLLLERRQPDRSRAEVLASLARDIDLVRVLAGDPARLSALGVEPGSDDTGWQSLVVGLSGPTSVPVRWQVGAGGSRGLRLSLQCDRGAASLWIPDEWSEPWSWTQPDQPVERPAWSAADAVLDLIERPPVTARRHESDESGVPAATWADAARAIEMAEAVPRSLARGRSIDLHQEEFSDLGTFRGTMASLGCGLLLAALALVIVAAVVGGLAHEFEWGLGGNLAGAWPVLTLAVLGGFLLLQLLPVLVGGGRKHE